MQRIWTSVALAMLALAGCKDKDSSKTAPALEAKEQVEPAHKEPPPKTQADAQQPIAVEPPTLAQLFADASKLTSASAVDESLDIAIKRLQGVELQRAALELVLSMANRDDELFLSLIADDGVVVNAAVWVKDDFEAVTSAGKRWTRAEVAEAIKKPGYYLGLLVPGDIDDAKTADWFVRTRGRGEIEINANGVHALARLKKHSSGKVFLYTVLLWDAMD